MLTSCSVFKKVPHTHDACGRGKAYGVSRDPGVSGYPWKMLQGTPSAAMQGPPSSAYPGTNSNIGGSSSSPPDPHFCSKCGSGCAAAVFVSLHNLVLLLVTSAAPWKSIRVSLKSGSHAETWNSFSSSLNVIRKTHFFTWVTIKQRKVWWRTRVSEELGCTPRAQVSLELSSQLCNSCPRSSFNIIFYSLWSLEKKSSEQIFPPNTHPWPFFSLCTLHTWVDTSKLDDPRCYVFGLMFSKSRIFWS